MQLVPGTSTWFALVPGTVRTLRNDGLYTVFQMENCYRIEIPKQLNSSTTDMKSSHFATIGNFHYHNFIIS